MKVFKLLQWFLVIIILSSFSFSDGYYDGRGDFNYYVSSKNPVIDINISSGTRNIILDKAFLSVNGVKSNLTNPKLGKTITRFQKENLIFKIENEIKDTDVVNFELEVYDQSSLKKIVPEGDPVKFGIIFDDTTPKYLGMKDMINSLGVLRFYFNEPIRLVTLTINDKKTIVYDNLASNLRLKSEDFIDIEIDKSMFDREMNNLKIEYIDFAQNSNSSREELLVSGDPLSIQLLTIQDDNTLKYNFASGDFKDLFSNNLYALDEVFTLKIKTNKESVCYLSNAISENSKPFLTKVTTKVAFKSTDNLIHTFDITKFDKNLWIACQNLNYVNEVAYLGDFLGIESREILKVNVYRETPIKITTYEPKSLVSSVPFSFYLETTSKGICYYKIGSEDKVLFDRKDITFKKFEKLGVSLNEGKYKLNYECVDVMNNKDSVLIDLEVNPNAGIKVTDYSPKYTMASLAKVQFSLSESNVDCTYAGNKSVKTAYKTLNPIGNQTGVSRGFDYTLKEGTNDIYLYCSNGVEVYENVLKIVYDTKGVILSNLKFVNGDYESDFLANTNQISFGFNVTSLIPIKKYAIEVVFKNSSKWFSITPSSSSSSYFKSSVKGDFEGATKLRVYGINIIDSNKSIEKNIQYDFTKPFLTFSNTGGGKKIICSDPESSCAGVFFGYSKTSLDCSAIKRYNDSILSLDDGNYICARAFNRVNMEEFIVETTGFVAKMNDSGNKSLIEEIYEDEGEDEKEDPKYIKDDPFVTNDEPADSSNTTTYAIFGALAFILAGVGGGGYYAYKKGYLNKELERFGIKPVGKGKAGTGSVNFTTTPIKNASEDKKPELKKSGYDDRLKKLNKFVDNKVRGSSDVFDKFNETTKGKTRYEDTLLKKSKSHDLSKEDIDEFYESSKSSSSKKENIEKEAESFEKYYKDKKSKKEN